MLVSGNLDTRASEVSVVCVFYGPSNPAWWDNLHLSNENYGGKKNTL